MEREDLKKRSWFKSSTEEIQQKILSLPPEADGFIADLLARPDVVGGVRQLQIVDVWTSGFMAKFSIMIQMLVQPIDKPGVVYTYEYHSWKQGPESGSKGLLLVETDGKITHYVVLRGEKFAPAQTVWDTVGGFSAPDEKGVEGMMARIKKELQEELGFSPKLKEVISLGRLRIDSGLTNNWPHCFAVIVEGEVKVEDVKDNLDIYEMRSGVVVLPIKEMKSFIEKNDDAYFSRITLVLFARGILPVELLK